MEKFRRSTGELIVVGRPLEATDMTMKHVGESLRGLKDVIAKEVEAAKVEVESAKKEVGDTTKLVREWVGGVRSDVASVRAELAEMTNSPPTEEPAKEKKAGWLK